MRFLAIIMSLVSWIDLILHMMIELCFPPFDNTTRSWRIFQKAQKKIIEWSKMSKMRFLAIFLSLVCWIDLILHFVIVLNVFIIQQCYQVMKDPSNITEMHFWMIIRAKNEGFGHFLEFSLLDRLDIAYCDSTKCFLTFQSGNSSWKIIQKVQNCIFEWLKESKMRFMFILLSLESFGRFWDFGLLDRHDIAYCVILLNVSQLVTLPGNDL